MTPKRPKRINSTEENYNIDDINSEDSTDDEEQPRKRIPKWAEGALHGFTKYFHNIHALVLPTCVNHQHNEFNVILVLFQDKT